jgi:hypothetical protein
MSPRELSQESLLIGLGVNDDFIFEVVVSTCSSDGTPNAAPMGIRFASKTDGRGGKEILINPFKSTTTYHNLSTQGQAVINISSDPRIFYETALKRQTGRGNQSKVAFSPSKIVRPPRAADCDAYIEVTVENLTNFNAQEKQRGEARCRIELIHLQNPRAKLYCRAPYVLIEAIIHATRVNELRSQGLAEEADQLSKLIDRYRKLIHNVAPSSQYEVMAEELKTIAGGMK